MSQRFIESQNTQFMIKELLPENHSVCEVMWENIVETGRPHITIWPLCVLHKHRMLRNLGYNYGLILCDTAFLLQQWLRERGSMLDMRTLPLLFVLSIISALVHSGPGWRAV